MGLLFGGSVLTDRDRADLTARGADAAFGPYAAEADMLEQIAAVVRRVRDDTSAEVTRPAAETGGALAGRVVIVTGAARGLGRAYTLELCRLGVAVVANDVDEAALKETVDAAGDTPGSVHPVVHDITDPNAARALLNAALRRYGLVANAGVLRSGPLLRLADDDLRLLLDVHVAAPFRLLRVLGTYWSAEAKAGRGVPAAAVLTTSAAGLYGFRAEAAYSTAKAAVAMLARVAADELGRYGATVNAIAPVARTRLTAWLPDSETGPDGDPLAPEHVAPVIAWLLGPEARDVNRRVIEVGNGQLSVPDAWKPGRPHPFPPNRSTDDVDALLRHAFATVSPPPAILRTDTY